ncbi:response regulator transcription factor [Gynurincola endophyticus]|jgi:two-component system response regulator NreC|uniref:response regulator transcription factor n=1 Tax=Gynurincola endophyticus TaxID=2479004 RepID=UPI000F8E0B79|nr:response regulator transcription factor [Gynurincola endophyticus]
MIRIFITDDHELYSEGLSLLLNREVDFEVVGTANSADQLKAALSDFTIDILLIDVHMPGNDEEELLKHIRSQHPNLKIIYLSVMRGTRYIHRLAKYQIQGYILKDTKVTELSEAIRTVHNGGTYFTEDINILDKSLEFRGTISIEGKRIDDILSKREIEILTLICQEYSNAQIAEKLFLSVSTIETHRKNLIAKLGVSNTVGLVKFAIKNNLIS